MKKQISEMSDYYSIARADFEYLESVKELEDTLPVQDEMMRLMENPNKETAAELYRNLIELWIREHGKPNRRIARIANRHLLTLGHEQ